MELFLASRCKQEDFHSLTARIDLDNCEELNPKGKFAYFKVCLLIDVLSRSRFATILTPISGISYGQSVNLQRPRPDKINPTYF